MNTLRKCQKIIIYLNVMYNQIILITNVNWITLYGNHIDKRNIYIVIITNNT